MNIFFKSTALKKICESEKESVRNWGVNRARKIRQRLAELNDADTLSDIDKFPPTRCHELEGNRKGQFAVDVSGNYRMTFQPAYSPIPVMENGGIDLKKITDIMILGVEDYHGH